MISAKTSELKARLAHYLRLAREGREVTVKDRETPVARLVPYRPSGPAVKHLIWKPRDPAAPPLGAVEVRGVRVPGIDTLSMLLDDRGRR
jgi:prevent-host-death family protein